MPRWLCAIFLIGVGLVLLELTHRAYRSGEIRAGSAFWKPFTPSRQDNPGAFRLYLALYFLGGLALCGWGLLAMVGMAPSMRWR